MPNLSRLLHVVICITFGLILSACGGGDDGDGGTSSSSSANSSSSADDGSSSSGSANSSSSADVGSSSSSSASIDRTPKVSLSGVVSKGPVDGATVNIYALGTNGQRGALLATATTETGAYSAVIEDYQGPIFVEAVGGQYNDESTSAATDNSELRAGFTIGTEDAVLASVTALTEIAVRSSETSPSANTQLYPPSDLEIANAQLSTAFGFDIVATQPADVTSAVASPGASSGQVDYGLALAALSQMSNNTATSIDQVLTDITTDLVEDATLNRTGDALNTALFQFIVSNKNLSEVSSIEETSLDESIQVVTTTPIAVTTRFDFVAVHQDWTSGGTTIFESETGQLNFDQSGGFTFDAASGSYEKFSDLTVSSLLTATDIDTGTYVDAGTSRTITFSSDPANPVEILLSANGDFGFHTEISGTTGEASATYVFTTRVRESGYSASDIVGRSYRGISMQKRFRDFAGSELADGLYDKTEFLTYQDQLTFGSGGICSYRLELERVRYRHPSSTLDGLLSSYTTDPTNFLVTSTSCTYTVSNDGLVDITVAFDDGSSGTPAFRINHNGSIVFAGIAQGDGVNNRLRARAHIYFRTPTTNYAAVNAIGSYRYVTEENDFGNNFDDISGLPSTEELFTVTGLLTLNSDGSCAITDETDQFANRSYDGTFSAALVGSGTGLDPTSCSWGTDGANGEIDITTGEFTLTVVDALEVGETGPAETSTITLYVSGNGSALYGTTSEQYDDFGGPRFSAESVVAIKQP